MNERGQFIRDKDHPGELLWTKEIIRNNSSFKKFITVYFSNRKVLFFHSEDRTRDIGENPAYDKSEYLVETFFFHLRHPKVHQNLFAQIIFIAC